MRLCSNIKSQNEITVKALVGLNASPPGRESCQRKPTNALPISTPTGEANKHTLTFCTEPCQACLSGRATCRPEPAFDSHLVRFTQRHHVLMATVGSLYTHGRLG